MAVEMRGPVALASRDGGRPASIADSVFATARQRPDSLAVSDEGNRVTYGQLADRALGIAAELAVLAIPRNALVAIQLPRGADLVVAAFGVLSSGRAYLLIDPELPSERARYMLADSRASALITVPDRIGSLGQGVPPVIDFYRVPARSAGRQVPRARHVPQAEQPDEIAYVCYTSGSTGLPKGVQITKSGLALLLGWYAERYATQPTDRMSQVASASFDAWGLEVWPCLSAGASLHVVPLSAVLSASALVAWLVSSDITVCFLPTPLAADVLRDEWPLRADRTCALRVMLTGGDRLARPPTVRPPFRLFNNYGPTECSVVATCAEITRFGTDAPPPIGRPLPHVQVALCRPDGTACADREPGELILSGPAVSPGYVGTGAGRGRLLVGWAPGEQGGGTYRTGDIVVRDVDGTLHFVGRIDDQVSISGVRIEPAEIEAALLRSAGVVSAAVVRHRQPPGDNGGDRLVAYVVGDIDQARLRAEAADRLPRAMVPSIFVMVDALPQTPNGKVDRAALARRMPVAAPSPGASRGQDDHEPEDSATAILREQWCGVLHVDQVAAADDFFEAGGDSLRVLRLVKQLRKRGLQLTPDDLFRCSTFGALAARLTGGSEKG